MDKLHSLPLVSVGIPTFNRAAGLNNTLKSITNQTYGNLEIIVSNNDSTDIEVEEVVYKYLNTDKRIKYFKQNQNIGPVKNFEYLLNVASGKYFMWASDDDNHNIFFIEECVSLLEKNNKVKFAMTDIQNVNKLNVKYREVPSFSRFSGELSLMIIIKYLLNSEFNGKANLFYGISDREITIKSFNKINWNIWGADMVFNLSRIIDSNGILISKKIYFKKMNFEAPVDSFVNYKLYNKKINYNTFKLYYNQYYAILQNPLYKLLAKLIYFSRLLCAALSCNLKR